MGNGTKIYKQVEQNELPDFLRELADAIEKGGSDELACVDDFKKFKVSGVIEYGQVMLKLKFKTENECASPYEDEVEPAKPGEPEKPSYKNLKKRMKTSFRMLVKMIHEGNIPPKEAVDSFLADSALMVTYAGYGDEQYDTYTKACAAFKAAYETGEIGVMHTTIDVLVHEKGRCHAKFA